MSCLVCQISRSGVIKTADEALSFSFLSGLYLVMSQRSRALTEMQFFVETVCAEHEPFVRSVLGGFIEDEEQTNLRGALVKLRDRIGAERTERVS